MLAECYPLTTLDDDPLLWGTLFGWLAVHELGAVMDADDPAGYSRSWMDEWQLGRLLTGALRDFGLDDHVAGRAVAAVALLTTHEHWYDDASEPHAAARVLTTWLQDAEIQRFLQTNRHNEILWFNREAFRQLLQLLWLVAVVRITADTTRTAAEITRDLAAADAVITALHAAEAISGYRIDRLLEAVKSQRPCSAIANANKTQLSA